MLRRLSAPNGPCIHLAFDDDNTFFVTCGFYVCYLFVPKLNWFPCTFLGYYNTDDDGDYDDRVICVGER